MAIPWLQADTPLPPTSGALDDSTDAPGLLAAGGDLRLSRLREAYSHGVFPWYGQGQPVLWWSPDPRMVLFTDEFKLSRSLRKTLQKFARTPGCELRIDSAFRRVITACAGMPRDGQDGTWIVPEVIDAYCRWHAEGRVHSVETWIGGELVGGLYGVSLGRMFFGESMFAHRTDASKIALAALVAFCRARGIETIDCQQRTVHLASLGAREIPRRDFRQRLGMALAHVDVADWSYDLRLWEQIGIA
jgi:leucyl/phenylalanyl-tRNA--protein transferase